MDIGSFTSWIQIVIWIGAAVLYIIRLATGKREVHPWIKQFLLSNAALGIIIALGLAISFATTVWPPVAQYFGWQSITVSISAYNEGANSTLEVVSGQTFEDTDVPLDGHVYKDCTFIDSCLLYNGGPYELQNATFKRHWKVCVKQPSALNNLANLLFSLDPNQRLRRAHKAFVTPRTQ